MRASGSAREAAARVVSRVIDDGAYVHRALDAELERTGMDRRDRAFAAALVRGVLTRLGTIDAALGARLERGLESLRPPARAALRVAAYQLLYLGDTIPARAAVDEAVKELGQRYGKAIGGLGNAVLRKLAADPTRYTTAAEDAPPHERLGLEGGLAPELAALLMDRLGPDEARRALDAWNGIAGTQVRVRRGSVEEAIEALASEGISAERHPVLSRALTCSGGNPARTRTAAEGRVIVRDGAAQLVTLAARVHDGARVLDACAGACGKTLDLFDRFRDAGMSAAEWVVADSDGRKLRAGIRDGGLDPSVRPLVHDLTRGSEGSGMEPSSFDLVLLDAPCSALGTLGRHPELRWKRSPDDIERLQEVQSQLLRGTAPLVRPGGLLIYAVCTWTWQEGPEQIRSFLSANPEFAVDAPLRANADTDTPWESLVDADGTVELWPHRHRTDGFWFARLRRRA